MTTINQNDLVTLHYVGTLSDGTPFDSSREKEKPFSFTAGVGMVVEGFDEAVLQMSVGETKTVTIPAAKAYGEYSLHTFQVAPKTMFEDGFDFSDGQVVSGQNNGIPFQAKIEGTTANHVVLDMNHPLAGHDLTFELEILAAEPQTV